MSHVPILCHSKRHVYVDARVQYNDCREDDISRNPAQSLPRPARVHRQVAILTRVDVRRLLDESKRGEEQWQDSVHGVGDSTVWVQSVVATTIDDKHCSVHGDQHNRDVAGFDTEREEEAADLAKHGPRFDVASGELDEWVDHELNGLEHVALHQQHDETARAVSTFFGICAPLEPTHGENFVASG